MWLIFKTNSTHLLDLKNEENSGKKEFCIEMRIQILSGPSFPCQ